MLSRLTLFIFIFIISLVLLVLLTSSRQDKDHVATIITVYPAAVSAVNSESGPEPAVENATEAEIEAEITTSANSDPDIQKKPFKPSFADIASAWLSSMQGEHYNNEALHLTLWQLTGKVGEFDWYWTKAGFHTAVRRFALDAQVCPPCAVAINQQRQINNEPDNNDQHSILAPEYVQQLLHWISGHPVTRQLSDPWFYQSDGQPRMLMINPHFIRALRQQLAIEANTDINGFNLAQVYDSLLYSYFRAAHLSYQLVHNHPQRAKNLQRYKDWVAKDQPSDQLFENFIINLTLTKNQPNSQQLQRPQPIDAYQYDLYVAEQFFDTDSFAFLSAFWLRRHLDGSSTELYHLVLDFLHAFDSQWLSQHAGVSLADIEYLAVETEPDGEQDAD